jgi:high-affinity Fe2+/Pb2+ permease
MKSHRARLLLSVGLGIVIGVLFHFALYRFGLPLKPFIYQAF